MDWLFILIGSFFASYFFGLSAYVPKKTRFISPLVGAVGYCIYLLIEPFSIHLSAFIATFFCCVLSEFLARELRTSATGLSMIAVIPLVPGVMLYETMLCFIEGNTLGGLESLVNTLMYAGMMAIGVTVATLVGRFVLGPLFKKCRDAKQK